MTIRNPRLRLILGTRWRLIVAGLVVVGLLSLAGAGLTYASPPTDTVTQQTHEQTVETTTTTRAEVVSEDALWPRGTVLVDQPVYLVNATPTLDATATTRVEGADDARVTHEWLLTVRAVRGEESFYSETAVLAEATHDGTTANTTATLDARAIRERVAAVQEQVGTAGTVTADLTLRVHYATDPGTDRGYEGTETYTAPVMLEPGAYAVGSDLGGTTDHSREATSTVVAPRDWETIAGLGLVGLLSLLLAGAVVAQRPGSIDLDEARIDLDRTRYEEWISPGIIPMGIDQQFIELESIEDVVDVAIDTNERVVFDRRRDLYAVISENVVYYFSPGGSWVETVFGAFGEPGAGPDGPGFDGSGGPGFGFGAPGEGSPFSSGSGADGAPFDTEGPEAPFGDAEGPEAPFGDTRGPGAPFGDADEREPPFDGEDGGDGAPDAEKTDGPFGGADEEDADDGPSGAGDGG